MLGIVETSKGKIRGVEMNGYTIFKGIPYAKPPVGTLRWKAPQEMEPWKNIWEADTFPNRCIQMEQDDFYKKEFYSIKDYETDMSEDCLYLNIWTPARNKDEKLPVAFYIHGGAFFNGYGHEMEFDGQKFCEQGVILVTINYRLGVLGFLAHPWLAEENANELAGNYGIRDQIAALRWVYENIGAFGGDSHNITVFGQSAGSMSVQTLVSSDMTEDMIAKAIFQSGGGLAGGLNVDLKMEEAFAAGERFAEICNVKSLQELRNLPAESIRQAALYQLKEWMETEKGLPYLPVIDHEVLKEGYDQIALNGKIKHIPYMLGTTKNDILVTKELLENNEFSSLYTGCIKWSHLAQKQTGISSYVYYFTRELPGDEAGAFHSSELWYVFGTLDRCWRPFSKHDYELSKKMIIAWTNFMKFGNPNGTEKNEWRACTEEDSYVHVFK